MTIQPNNGDQQMDNTAIKPTRSGPGALRSSTSMKIQTRQAQRLVYGRKYEGDKPAIVGLLRFATLLRVIWTGAAADDPYADWYLVLIDQALTQSREDIKAMKAQVAGRLTQIKGVSVTVAESLNPIRVDLNFTNPYAFMGAYLLADYDALVRAVLTARHVALLDRGASEKMLHEGGRCVRRAFECAHGYRYLALTRDDVRQGTSKAARAKEMFGPLHDEVLAGTLRAAHAPDIRLRRKSTEGSEPVFDQGNKDGAGAEVEFAASGNS